MNCCGNWTRVAYSLLALPFILGGTSEASGIVPAYFGPASPQTTNTPNCPARPKPPTVIPQHWFAQAPPPATRSNCANYAFGPLTDATSISVQTYIASKWSGGMWPSIWWERGPVSPGHSPKAPNPVSPQIPTPSCTNPNTHQMGAGSDGTGNFYAYADYSSNLKAYAATKASALRMLGVPTASWQLLLNNNGVSQLSINALKANPASFINFNGTCNSNDGNSYVVRDAMIVQDNFNTIYSKTQGPYPTGVRVDYAPLNYPDPTDAGLKLVDLANAIHKQSFSGGHSPKLYFYTNPYNYDMPANGLTSTNMGNIKVLYDYIGMYLIEHSQNGSLVCNIQSEFNSSVQNIKGTSGVPYSKIIITFDMLYCDAGDALDVFNLNKQYKFAGYMIFPDLAVMGGQTTPLKGPNLLLWNLMYGAATPPPAKLH